MKSLKIFTICEICPVDHLKAEKIRGYKGSFLAICNFRDFFPLSQIWSYEFLFPTGTKKGTSMFNGTANLKKFHRRKRDKSYSKDPCCLCRKTLRQDRYLSMRRLSNRPAFGNLSLCVFFSVDLFFGSRRPMNITNAVAGNPRFHHIETFLC